MKYRIACEGCKRKKICKRCGRQLCRQRVNANGSYSCEYDGLDVCKIWRKGEKQCKLKTTKK